MNEENIKCIYCGLEYESYERVCPNCGTKNE